MTKRYILFMGETYYPAGWNDYAGSFDTIDGAKQHWENRNGTRSDWYELLDTYSEKVVRSSWGDNDAPSF